MIFIGRILPFYLRIFQVIIGKYTYIFLPRQVYLVLTWGIDWYGLVEINGRQAKYQLFAGQWIFRKLIEPHDRVGDIIFWNTFSLRRCSPLYIWKVSRQLINMLPILENKSFCWLLMSILYSWLHGHSSSNMSFHLFFYKKFRVLCLTRVDFYHSYHPCRQVKDYRLYRPEIITTNFPHELFIGISLES